ncbi:hypothetical protein [Modestobacter sp. VKM Ac-2984]|uniref:hypothetical protein n=1 Tax=Modestobacter sp. VKM Ac-2984 TaxID=3004138 RepID=UPI0022AA338F|nr:hypothetical protein [Modestobacter sp. VKM Ac-2984]MCZ2814916.1 hypothetical protein [Modestobacter sp. VKM Ac-2984]
MAWVVGLGVAFLIACLLVALVGMVDAEPWPAFWAAVVAVAVRIVLVENGFVFGTGPIRFLDLTVASVVLLYAASLRALFAAKASAEQGVALMAGALALPVAAYTLLQLVFPAGTAPAGGPPCDGSPVAGAEFLAQTGPNGLNGRAGPGTTFAPEGRYGASCVVGADAYCIGDGVNDLSVPLPDVRWLRLHNSDIYVSAGSVFPLSADSELGTGPAEDCPLGLADPSLEGEVSATAVDAETVELSARPVNSTLVGFGLFYERPGKEPLIQALDITPYLTDDEGNVRFPVRLQTLRDNEPEALFVDVAVVPCLAPIIPSHEGEQLLRIDLQTGQASPLESSERADHLTRMRHAACRTDPSSLNDKILEVAGA